MPPLTILLMNLKTTQILKRPSSFRSPPSSQPTSSFFICSSQFHGNAHQPNQGICLPFTSEVAISSENISACNSLITNLSRSGDLASACRLFNEMPQRDTVSWNSIMSACLHNGQPEQALSIFPVMRSHGLKLSSTSFSVAISSCGECGALDQGRMVHGLSIKNAYSANVFVGTSLISFYSKCKVFDCLCRVFDEMNCPSLASWNALISGYVMNHQIDDAHSVFNRMPTRNVISWTSLINGYVEVKKIRDAYELFKSMPVKNSITWSVILGGFVNAGQYDMALELFIEMLNNGVEASLSSIVIVISASSNLRNCKQGKKFHAFATKLGHDLDKVVESSLVCMYTKCLNIDEARVEFDKFEGKYRESWNSLISGYICDHRIDDAQILFDQMNDRDQVTWNSMIDGYLKSNRTDEAVEMFKKMPEPTVETITSLMSAFIKNEKLHEALRLFHNMPKKDVIAYSTLISGYMKAGQIVNAWELFEKMPDKNVVTYNIMISGLVQQGKVTEAYKLFCRSPMQDSISWSYMIMGYVQEGLNDDAFRLYHQMTLVGVQPSDLVIASILTACANLSFLSFGEQIHAVTIKNGFNTSLLMENSLLNMYSKAGDMYSARFIFEKMPEHDLITWNAMIHGYAINSHSLEALEMFEYMKKLGLEPDHVTFLGVLCACAHGGLVEKAWVYFLSMKCDHRIIPRITHYSCMVNLLCRSGLVGKAEELVDAMPIEPDSIIWTSLLSGCKFNNNIRIAERAANKLFELNNQDLMPYLHLSRIYAFAGRKAEVDVLRRKMYKLGLQKNPGCSWIDLNGEIRSFFARNRSHLLYEEI